MLYRLITFFALIITTPCFSQQTNDSAINQSDIVGVWQIRSSVVSSALQANFRFFKTGKFIYNLDNYNDLNPIYSISGLYKIDKNILYLKIEQINQLTGFKVVESNPAFQFGPFILDGGKVFTVQQNDSAFSEHLIHIMKNKKTTDKGISIDADNYFMLSSDPNKFSK